MFNLKTPRFTQTKDHFKGLKGSSFNAELVNASVTQKLLI